ncbi:diguanylate cyclase [Paenacidovorax monticola]|uniref:Diguanylate cyclase n=1 Tax=Paenacidovorax monticola TaxID=1926868 RepID=A0A7H0HJY7_9BURK|nr:diguanylate cyclase [Paenacidovorax monticola]
MAESASKSEALRVLQGRNGHFSFIFLDFKLEDGDGRELLPDIWETVGSDCVVIAVTGNGTEQSAAEAIKLGIHEYLSKHELSVDRVVNAIDDGLRWLEDNKRTREMESALLHRSLHDPLTDLYNRHVFFERLEHQCALYRREGTACAVLVIDLDQFKQINDRLGHEMGDVLLVQAAHRMRDTIREIDTIARLGGDEFACIMPGVRTLRQAAALGGKISACMDAPFALGSEMVRVGASVGISVCPQHGCDPTPSSTARTTPCTAPSAASRAWCCTTNWSLRAPTRWTARCCWARPRRRCSAASSSGTGSPRSTWRPARWRASRPSRAGPIPSSARSLPMCSSRRSRTPSSSGRSPWPPSTPCWPSCGRSTPATAISPRPSTSRPSCCSTTSSCPSCWRGSMRPAWTPGACAWS